MSGLLSGVTISIVTYNTWPRTLECIRSVMEQDIDTQFEVLLIDNGASPDSLVVPSGVNVYRAESNVGFGAGHNLNMRRANYDHFLILNPDTTLRGQLLPHLLDAIRQPGVLAVAPRLINDDGSVQESVRKFPTLRTEIARITGGDRRRGSGWSTLLEVDSLMGRVKVEQPAGAAILTRTEYLRQIGGFDERFPMYFEDVDLCRRIIDDGAIVYDSATKLIHDGEGTAKSFRAATTFWIEFSRVVYHKKHARGARRAGLVLAARLSCLTHYLASTVAGVARPTRRQELFAKARGYKLALSSTVNPSVGYWKHYWGML